MDQEVVVDRMLLPELVVISADLVVESHLHELVKGGSDTHVGRRALK
jgi:hypothetical protein